MLHHSAPSHLYTAASCFEDNDHTEDITGENMLKQPLIMSDESLEDEEQTDLSKVRQIRSIICKSLLLGIFIGFALQVIPFAAWHALSKMFGKDPKPTPGSLLSSFSYCMLVLIGQLDLAMYVVIMLTFMYTMTKSGSLYMRKKFDRDAANPNSGSIWTPRMLIVVGIYFLFGATVGSSFSHWIILALRMEMAIPLMPILYTLMVDFVLLFLVSVGFDWSHSGYATEQEELEDDDSSFVV